MGGDIETTGLILFIHPQANHCIHHLEDDPSSHERVKSHRGRRLKLYGELGSTLVVPAPIQCAAGTKERQQQRSDNAAHTVYTEDIQRIIVAEFRLDGRARVPADEAGGQAND